MELLQSPPTSFSPFSLPLVSVLLALGYRVINPLRSYVSTLWRVVRPDPDIEWYGEWVCTLFPQHKKNHPSKKENKK